ncbi:hypothetical protein HYZ76_02695 [Candidatus Falkowbacteria bacterium]|nr:hypothetical protein [Candidatus Falkowbacteria bacterium]
MAGQLLISSHTTKDCNVLAIAGLMRKYGGTEPTKQDLVGGDGFAVSSIVKVTNLGGLVNELMEAGVANLSIVEVATLIPSAESLRLARELAQRRGPLHE